METQNSVMLEVDPELNRDLLEVTFTMSAQEARFLVDLYYQIQDERKRAAGQIRATTASGEPNDLLKFFFGRWEKLENDIKKALDRYSKNHPACIWMCENVLGIAGVLSVGLVAHFDIKKAPTVGHFWNFAGLNPAVEWEGKKGAEAAFKECDGDPDKIAAMTGRKPAQMREWAALGKKKFLANLSKPPYNKKLKMLCWKIGESFLKLHNNPKSYYGKVYFNRMIMEWTNNAAGKFADQAKNSRAGDTTATANWTEGRYKGSDVAKLIPQIINHELLPSKMPEMLERVGKGEGTRMLCPGQILARSKRYAVKRFLAHLHEVWYMKEFGKDPPNPYPIAHLGHAHWERASDAEG